MTTLSGEVSRLRYSDSGQGFAVFDVVVEQPAELAGSIITAVGAVPGIADGVEVRLSGEFRSHPRFGRQFRCSSGMVTPPSSGRGLRAFLASGSVEGIGKVLAARLAEHFGDGLRQALDSGAHALRSCPGIGPGRAASISEAWRKGVLLREAVILLCEMGLSPAQSTRIAGIWGEAAPSRVAADPWDLQRYLRGFGFRTADRIAMETGIDPQSPLRIRAAARYVLATAQDAGHLFMPSEQVRDAAADLISVSGDLVSGQIGELVLSGELVVEPDRTGEGEVLFLKANHLAETSAAAVLGRLVLSGSTAAKIDRSRWENIEHLAPSQRRALGILCSSAISVLTGGPGTGKTTVTGELISICRAAGIRVALAAPTGRAAMRLRETSGTEARTLHRLLEYNPSTDSFQKGPDAPVDADWVVVDESSMIDMQMFAALVDAVRPGCRLTLVGDADQLPPVGPGDPFREVIRSGVVPVARLTEVFRQGEGSSIVAAAHSVMAGEMPKSDRSSSSDPGEFHMVLRESPEDAASMVLALVCERIPARFGLDPRRDIQVLSPMKKGTCGTDELNEAIRHRLNAGMLAQDGSLPRFLPGDRVIQTRNNYDLDVFNGDIGVVTGPTGDGGLAVMFDRREVQYPSADLDEVAPAAAVTVHKAQGSEFPAVVICLHNQHFVMLRRNLLYTAITRGRKVVVLVGSARAIGMSVSNFIEEKRNTMLAGRIRDAVRGGQAGACAT